MNSRDIDIIADEVHRQLDPVIKRAYALGDGYIATSSSQPIELTATQLAALERALEAMDCLNETSRRLCAVFGADDPVGSINTSGL